MLNFYRHSNQKLYFSQLSNNTQQITALHKIKEVRNFESNRNGFCFGFDLLMCSPVRNTFGAASPTRVVDEFKIQTKTENPAEL